MYSVARVAAGWSVRRARCNPGRSSVAVGMGRWRHCIVMIEDHLLTYHLGLER